MVVLVVLWSGFVGSFPCEFNTMCTCKSPPNQQTNHTRDITCLGVPLSRLPGIKIDHSVLVYIVFLELSGSWIEHIDVVEGGLEIVEGDSLALPHLGSLRLISNQILLLAPKALV